eukprot:CAMPEP_0115867304 /NCGR_PEP_ID=MMETSP0287-20121206/20700_1 /TAXON_ID=412157 /ORGANISM="Chrysochromulina rotalis, Strain UIO044" /LENGTH=82 /DNA_ID=CAMNT_0003321907 /DNA_START=491 /DNA_END=736 /DNA_ORIENTATION=-
MARKECTCSSSWLLIRANRECGQLSIKVNLDMEGCVMADDGAASKGAFMQMLDAGSRDVKAAIGAASSASRMAFITSLTLLT